MAELAVPRVMVLLLLQTYFPGERGKTVILAVFAHGGGGDGRGIKFASEGERTLDAGIDENVDFYSQPIVLTLTP